MLHESPASSQTPVSFDEYLAKAKAKDNAQMADELKAAATAKVMEVVQPAQSAVQDRSQESWNGIQRSPLFADVNRFIHEQPAKALFTTFGLGIVVGLTVRRLKKISGLQS